MGIVIILLIVAIPVSMGIGNYYFSKMLNDTIDYIKGK